jgi:hypothetical protein
MIKNKPINVSSTASQCTSRMAIAITAMSKARPRVILTREVI